MYKNIQICVSNIVTFSKVSLCYIKVHAVILSGVLHIIKYSAIKVIAEAGKLSPLGKDLP